MTFARLTRIDLPVHSVCILLVVTATIFMEENILLHDYKDSSVVPPLLNIASRSAKAE